MPIQRGTPRVFKVEMFTVHSGVYYRLKAKEKKEKKMVLFLYTPQLLYGSTVHCKKGKLSKFMGLVADCFMGMKIIRREGA